MRLISVPSQVITNLCYTEETFFGEYIPHIMYPEKVPPGARGRTYQNVIQQHDDPLAQQVVETSMEETHLLLI